MKALRSARPWLVPLGLVLLVLIVVAACAPGGANGSPGASGPSGTPQHPLKPASPNGSDPTSLISFAFTPIFQTMFIILAGAYSILHSIGVPGAIGVAIIILTLIVRTILIPLFRRQLVSQRRMQMLQPELAEIRKRYKGDRVKAQQAQQEVMRERGVNPVAGCLPLLLQLPLLFIIYSVIQNGLTSYDPTPMLHVAGVQLVPLTCPTTPPPPGVIQPCIDTKVPWLFGLDISHPSTLVIFGFGLSLLAVVSALLQLVQSRMMLTTADPTNDDPNARVQRQMMLFLPLISVLYGGILPAGVFIYWIVATIFSIVQQYLIVGWGAMFPIFGWYPAFARNHQPRFPVALPAADPTKRSTPAQPSRGPTTRTTSAEKTIRPRERGRQGRRGRRR
ncbi:MAG: YidC/Oxa1 family membrane protein insertase [Chloroflexota bacterium]